MIAPENYRVRIAVRRDRRDEHGQRPGFDLETEYESDSPLGAFLKAIPMGATASSVFDTPTKNFAGRHVARSIANWAATMVREASSHADAAAVIDRIRESLHEAEESRFVRLLAAVKQRWAEAIGNDRLVFPSTRFLERETANALRSSYRKGVGDAHSALVRAISSGALTVDENGAIAISATLGELLATTGGQR